MFSTASLLALILTVGAAPAEVDSGPDRVPEVYEITRALTAGLVAELEAQEAAARAEAEQEVPAWMRVRAKSKGMEITSVGLLLVGGVTWAIGQIQLDTLGREPPGPERSAREASAYTLNVGGLGTVIAGAAVWFIAVELAHWPADVPVTAVVSPTDGGAQFRLGMRFP